jgi:hypothetical protein
MHLAGESLRGFFRSNANRLAGAYVDERGRDFPPVPKLQGTFAQATTGDYGNGIGGTPVDFDEGDEALAIFFIAARVIYTELRQAKHCEPHTEDLPGAEMSMGLLGVNEIFIEGFHGNL